MIAAASAPTGLPLRTARQGAAHIDVAWVGRVVKLIEDENLPDRQVGYAAQGDDGCSLGIICCPCGEIVRSAAPLAAATHTDNRGRVSTSTPGRKHQFCLIWPRSSKSNVASRNSDCAGQVVRACIQEHDLSAGAGRDRAVDLRGRRAGIQCSADGGAIGDACRYAGLAPVSGTRLVDDPGPQLCMGIRRKV